MLGDDSTAIVGSDRFSAYGHLPMSRRQVCWAHLRRTFEDFVARGGEAASVGQKLLEYTAQLFTWWHRIRDGTLQLSSFQVYVSRHLRFRVRFELWYGQQFADAKTAATCGNLLATEPALWTFVRKNGDVEPTNNAAERQRDHRRKCGDAISFVKNNKRQADKGKARYEPLDSVKRNGINNTPTKPISMRLCHFSLSWSVNPVANAPMNSK